MAVELKRASVHDAREIHRIQVNAFSALLEKYRDHETNPAAEPVEKVIKRLEQPFTYFYFILNEGVTVGAIRVTDPKDGVTRKRISPIFILPQYRNRGLAQEAISEAERIHGSDYWSLDTILQEDSLCRLYEKMGYHRTGRTEKINDRLTLVFYEKNGKER